MEQYLINGEWCEKIPLKEVKKSQIFYIRRSEQVQHSNGAVPYKKKHEILDGKWRCEKIGDKYKYDYFGKALSGDKLVYVPIK